MCSSMKKGYLCFWLFLSAAALFTSACATFPSRPEPPRVTLAGLTVVSMDLFEQRYRMKLRVQNPNNYRLPLSGMEYTLELNDRRFATGVSSDDIDLPAFGEKLIVVDVSSNLLQLLDQVHALEGGGEPSLRYRLAGHVGVVGRNLKLPFEYTGEVSLALDQR